ncbi:MAG: amidase [Actinobacteria bacterium]|nr:amidase [Actinomycetota bacterium]
MAHHEAVCELTLAEVGERIKQGDVSPVEVARACLDRIQRLNHAYNAAITVLADQALEDARRSEREILGGLYRGPLHGVPVGIKDLADVAGAPTTAGSHLFDGRTATVDAAVVRQLRAAGASIMAKLNTDEFAYHPTGATSQFGPSRNPWDPAYMTGGSSGGSGAAVAARMVYGALGSDTGGSIRLPASACGVVGIKPTYGRVSLAGMVLLAPTFDTPGPLARTTLDAALLLQGMVDPAFDAALREANRASQFLSEIDASPAGLRVGVPANYFFDGNDEEITTLTRRAVDSLTKLGVDLVNVDLPTLPALAESQVGILTLEAHANIMAATGGDLTKVNATLRARLELGLSNAIKPGEHPQVALGRLRAVRDDALAGYRRATGAIDLLVAPAMRRAPLRIDRALQDYHALADLTRPFNATQQPVVCVPCGLTSAGVPLGLQIVATKYRERSALRLARAFELSDAAPKNLRPPLP